MYLVTNPDINVNIINKKGLSARDCIENRKVQDLFDNMPIDL